MLQRLPDTGNAKPQIPQKQNAVQGRDLIRGIQPVIRKGVCLFRLQQSLLIIVAQHTYGYLREL